MALPDLQEPECSDLSGSTRLVDLRARRRGRADRRPGGAGAPRRALAHIPAEVLRRYVARERRRAVRGQPAAVLRVQPRRGARSSWWPCCGDRHLDLRRRAHHHVLLLLARRRLTDERAGLPAAGARRWLTADELLKMLRMDDNHLNICIHRARARSSVDSGWPTRRRWSNAARGPGRSASALRASSCGRSIEMVRDDSEPVRAETARIELRSLVGRRGRAKQRRVSLVAGGGECVYAANDGRLRGKNERGIGFVLRRSTVKRTGCEVVRRTLALVIRA